MKDQVTELYRTMEQYGLIPKEAAPAAETVVVKRRGRPPKRPEGVPAQTQAAAGGPHRKPHSLKEERSRKDRVLYAKRPSGFRFLDK